MLVHAASLLVDVEALACFHENGFTVRVIEIAHDLVRIEIELLNAERRRNFTTLIHFVAVEHGLTSHVLDDVARLGVSEVTTLVDWFPLLVVLAAILVFQNDNITFIISIEVA